MIRVNSKSVKSSAGLTLIEVLVTLLVLSIGLIALGSLNLLSVRSAQSSYYVSIATSMALDLEERLWLAASQLETGCLSDTEIDSIIADKNASWTATEERLGLPARDGTLIEATKVNVTPGTDNLWIDVEIPISWSDNRIDDSVETFTYSARVTCSPFDNPPDPTG